ncbi:MAG: tRNA pseudouridine(55) synthase TruB [Candidatus Aminicenantes bacterium]|nr:tRNA pseudouridine(55) synthase TruB [Candidatus Aminicenantes bacterium]
MSLDGIILVHKPDGCTSHDIVKNIRKILKQKKVGHYGTLDPMATGLMLIALGKATRLFPFFSKLDKEYTGEITLGFATDSYDATGAPATPISHIFPKEDELVHNINAFQGKLNQIPPAFSAKKYKGQPLYKLARAQKEVSPTPSQVIVYSFKLESYSPPHIEFMVRCSTGTYIRSLAHDLGKKLGCGAHLSRLERTRVGDYSLQDAHTLDSIEAQEKQDSDSDFILPIEDLLPQFPKLILKDSAVQIAQNGNTLLPEHALKLIPPVENATASQAQESEIFRVFSPEGKLVAFARKESNSMGLHPFLVIDSNVQIS